MDLLHRQISINETFPANLHGLINTPPTTRLT
jgi:hypothetical protein